VGWLKRLRPLFCFPIPCQQQKLCPARRPYIATRPQLTKGTLPSPPGLNPERALALANLQQHKAFLGKQQIMAASFFFFDAEPVCEPVAPALNACALCAKRLGRDSDIFMYRGDTPFCSEECRYEQMQLDVIRERRPAGRKQQYSTVTESRPAQSTKVSVAS
jgi:hypothetical protein